MSRSKRHLGLVRVLHELHPGVLCIFFFFQAEDGIRDDLVTGVQTCALPIFIRRRFGIEAGGNAPQDPQGEFTGMNLLYTASWIDEVAAETGRTPADVIAVLGRARQVLFDARAKRPRPHLDDKVLTSWNGMMIAAFARAARVLPERPPAADWLATARRAAEFIFDPLWDRSSPPLLRRYRDGDASGIDGYAEDYASLIRGLLELVQADGDPTWLSWARELQAQQ